MANLIEIRNGAVVGNDQPDDINLPVGTPISQPDGHYIAIGMDVEGPLSREQAHERLDHMREATRRELEAGDRTAPDA
ncbi:hypothetical protein N825_18155 [Skermanella stibiiresistens SB22]|uniref:Uncharacterized protein n=1 Tax=Skermanella stibiiresistens SB22 TaxID=1385369 RepID=W9H7T5_9PROT|nr:hypothetical protein [Skermanella stibiiresistens]EWY42295.1 hypothetical protein N825_18155 [Skermanella stibiiresistens SB22]